MSEKTELVICLGSSCFARGNKGLVKLIDNFLKEHRLKDKVYYHGGHCNGRCALGPTLRINDTIYENINEENVFTILKDFFNIT